MTFERRESSYVRTRNLIWKKPKVSRCTVARKHRETVRPHIWEWLPRPPPEKAGHRSATKVCGIQTRRKSSSLSGWRTCAAVFPDPALAEALPVPLGHSDPVSIRTSRPPGHARPLLGAVQQKARPGWALAFHGRTFEQSTQYQFGSFFSCSLSKPCMPASGLPRKRYSAWRVGDLSAGRPAGTSTNMA